MEVSIMLSVCIIASRESQRLITERSYFNLIHPLVSPMSYHCLATYSYRHSDTATSSRPSTCTFSINITPSGYLLSANQAWSCTSCHHHTVCCSSLTGSSVWTDCSECSYTPSWSSWSRLSGL